MAVCLTALAAAGLEGLAGAAAFRGAWALALALHAASCGAVATLHPRLLEGPGLRGFSLLFAGTFFLPVLGPLGLAALVPALPPPEGPPGPEMVRRPIPGSPRAGAAAPASPPSRSGREARLAEVAGARRRSDPMAVALLWRALRDPDEDVRLLAHALLESKSRQADGRIHQLYGELEAAPASGRAPIHRRLAFEHWELAWLGLAQGDCLAHALEAARRHALVALDGEPRPAPLHFLLARIALRRGEVGGATAALRRAAELGLPASLLAPYLAEAAFLARRLDLVRRALAGAGGGGEAVERVRRYWS